MKKKAALHNLGCKVNAYETEAMQELLEQNGYEIVPFKEGADVYIINTCTVTNVADRKSRQMLHKARKMNPDAVVVATGCYVQARGEDIDPCVDIVVGNNKKKDLIAILDEYYNAQHKVKKELLDINHEKEYEEMQVTHTAEHTRAYIKVQDGCNQFCSYCIIPYARGRVRSRNLEHVLEEVRTLAASGYKEVVLTGIHLSSYGIDTGESLLELIQKVHEIDGIKRIRLGSLEPRIITEEFASSIAALPKMCPHFHLSLQSGCNATLKRMNRRYSAEEYMEKCDLLRKYFHNPALTTDVIVGFPTETREDFLKTIKTVKALEFAKIHVFPFSLRNGTKAEEFENIVTVEEKKQRARELLDVSKELELSYFNKFVGKEEEVLIEQYKDGYSYGHTSNFLYVKIPKKLEHNTFYKTTIKEVNYPYCIGD